MTEQPQSAERAIVVTAADDRFFALLAEMIASIRAAKDAPPIDIGCLDLGLTPEQIDQLSGWSVRTARPVTGLNAPHLTGLLSNLSFLARPYLPENFPGYAVYLWLDADTWIQSGGALRDLVDATHECGAALVREDEPTYKSNVGLFLWKAKHYLLGYGPWRGAKLLFRPQINNGVFAIRADAPHWLIWRRCYQSALSRTGLAAPHDQFSLNEAAHLGGLPTRFLPATFNWICDLSRPDWDEESNGFCSPDGQRRRIEIIHLAGPVKTKDFTIRGSRGGQFLGKLRYGAKLTRLTASAPASNG